MSPHWHLLQLLRLHRQPDLKKRQSNIKAATDLLTTNMFIWPTVQVYIYVFLSWCKFRAQCCVFICPDLCVSNFLFTCLYVCWCGRVLMSLLLVFGDGCAWRRFEEMVSPSHQRPRHQRLQGSHCCRSPRWRSGWILSYPFDNQCKHCIVNFTRIINEIWSECCLIHCFGALCAKPWCVLYSSRVSLVPHALHLYEPHIVRQTPPLIPCYLQILFVSKPNK